MSLGVGRRDGGATGASPLRVLIVDDTPGDAYLTRMALSDGPLPCEVSAAGDGAAGLDLMRRDPSEVDLVLLDLNMPRMNGFDVLQHLKADPDLRGIPVVVLTNSRSEADREEALRLGAAAFFSKPFDIDCLARIICDIEDLWLTRRRDGNES